MVDRHCDVMHFLFSAATRDSEWAALALFDLEWKQVDCRTQMPTNKLYICSSTVQQYNNND